MKAEKNIPTIMPERSSFVLLKNPPRCERNQTKIIVKIAPAKPKTGMNKYKPMTPARMLPKAAPEEIPKIYGSAKGLFNIIWKEKPTPAKMKPVKKANKIRGNLTERIICFDEVPKLR